MIFDVLENELKNISREIIVVDNGSDDGTVDYLMFKDCQKILNQENMGISIGKNQGIRSSNGEYILLLDGDVVPVPNSIRLLINFLDENQDKQAVGFYPYKFSIQPNGIQEHHEKECYRLFEPKISTTVCLFYGLFRKEVFDKCMLDESGEYGKPGYGWEDHDFFNQMQQHGIKQWVVHMNHTGGKYYHYINSSIRSNCLGYKKYQETSEKRGKQYREKWEACLAR